MEGHVGGCAAVAAKRQVFRAWFPLHRRGIPDPDGPIDARRGELVAVGAEDKAKDVVDVTAQREDRLPGCGVPDLDRLIQTGGGEAEAIGAVGHGPQPAYVAVQAVNLVPGM